MYTTMHSSEGHIEVSLTLTLKVNRQGQVIGDHGSFKRSKSNNIR